MIQDKQTAPRRGGRGEAFFYPGIRRRELLLTIPLQESRHHESDKLGYSFIDSR